MKNYVFFRGKAVEETKDAFRFSYMEIGEFLSKTMDCDGGLHVNSTMRNHNDSQFIDFLENARSVWFRYTLMSPQYPAQKKVEIRKSFYIQFFDDHYFVDGILNKNYAYGSYPNEKEKSEIVSHFKQELLNEMKENL